MFAWHRCIAALMIIVFAPVSALAAVTLKLCFGNDGHRAIEAVFTPHHHDVSVLKKIAKNATAQTLPSWLNAADCRDVPIVAANQQTARANVRVDHPDIPKKFECSSPIFPQPSAGLAFCESRRSARVHEEIQFRDPHLVSLATIVLLN